LKDCRLGAYMVDIGSFEPDDLKNIPTFRAAYSDRTALLMAKLAYRAYTSFDVDDAAFRSFNDELCKQGFTACKGLIDRDVGTAGYVVDGSDILVYRDRGASAPSFVEKGEPLPRGRATIGEEFLHHLETGEPLHPTLALPINLATVAILDAGMRSAEKGTSEPVASVPGH